MAEVSHLWRVVQLWLDGQQFPPNQSKLAKALDVQRSAVSDWKTGKTKPTPEHLRRLAELMEPALGPDTHDMLLVALMNDLGYDMNPKDGIGGQLSLFFRDNRNRVVRYARKPRDGRGGSPSTKVPATGPANQPAERNLRRRSSDPVDPERVRRKLDPDYVALSGLSDDDAGEEDDQSGNDAG